jgi:tRNA A22 N-methylase
MSQNKIEVEGPIDYEETLMDGYNFLYKVIACDVDKKKEVRNMHHLMRVGDDTLDHLREHGVQVIIHETANSFSLGCA